MSAFMSSAVSAAASAAGKNVSVVAYAVMRPPRATTNGSSDGASSASAQFVRALEAVHAQRQRLGCGDVARAQRPHLGVRRDGRVRSAGQQGDGSRTAKPSAL
jgi:hypothetical protein